VTLTQVRPPEVSGSIGELEPGQLYGEVVGAFEEVALLASSDSANMNDVLRLVGRRLCELLRVSRCSVYLRRNDGRFQGQVGYCIGRLSIDAGVSKLVSGVSHDLFTAEIVRTSAPVLVRNAAHDPRTIQRTMRQWGVRDMLGVPLVADAVVIGIIYADNQGVHHDYTDRDVKLAQAFAGLSALAVRQAWLYRQLGERTKIIDEQRRILGESAAVHNRVTRALLDGAGIEEILQLIVELLGKPAVLYSPDMDVVAWSLPESLGLRTCPAMTRAQAAMPLVQRALEELNDGRSTVMLRATPESRCRRLLVRLLAGAHCIGYLELCELGRSFSQVDSKALEQAGTAVALKLLAAQRSTDAHREEREEYFSDILYGRRDLGSLKDRAKSFGVDTGRLHVVLRLQYERDLDDDNATGHARRRSVAGLISDSLEPGFACVGSTSVPGADLLIFQVPVVQAGSLAESLREVFPTMIEQFGVRFAVVADPGELGDLPRSSEKLREVADLLRETSESPRLVLARDLELIRLITRREGIQGAQRCADEMLDPLVRHDETNGGALVETLRAFVACDAQIRPTAAMLSVHENTVRYRLSRIREISAIEPERLDSLLGVAVALQVQSLRGAGQSSGHLPSAQPSAEAALA
jgi:sugar diacid utilization regulator